MSGDNAIKSRAEDRLGPSGFADQLMTALVSETADDGLVVALLVPWGRANPPY